MSGGEETSGASTRQRNALILAVDDDPDTLEIIGWILSSQGFDVITATSGYEALRRVEARQPDLVIVDYMMPGMNGLTLCRALRARPATHSIPIILHTGTPPERLPSHGGLYERLVTKPTDLFFLESAIRSLLVQTERP